jgi:hypothetical protein
MIVSALSSAGQWIKHLLDIRFSIVDEIQYKKMAEPN